MQTVLVNIDVPELSAGIDFYVRGLGLAFGRYLFDRAVAELHAASLRVYLIEQSTGSRPVPGHPTMRDYGPHWTPVHLDVVVDDIDTALGSALAAGASARAPVSDYVWGRLARLQDPFGHGVCLIEFRGTGYDTVAVPGPD